MTDVARINRADPLADVLLADRPASHVVAGGKAGVHLWPDFLRHVGAAAAWLESLGAKRCLVLAEDCYEFAVGFLGAARAGCQIVLAGNLQPGHVGEVASDVDAAIADRMLPDVPLPQWRRGDAAAGARVLSPAPLVTEAVEIVMYTSGSTGAAQRITRTLQTLSAEVATLEACFGDQLGDCRVMGTVPPYHIYGLLHRILWPLSVGRMIACETIHFPPEVPDRLAAGETPVCLVASPAFLTRALPVLDLGKVSSAVRAIFSSGGPLPPETGAAFNTGGIALQEIYGSTETGGIAHRRVFDAASPPAWEPLPTVAVRRNEASGQLVVQSPHLCVPEPFLCGDKISPLDREGRFFLLGRVDRVVKIEERRLSLDELEQCLKDCAEVKEARFLAMTRNGRAGLGAVVVPSDAGWAVMETEDRQALAQRLSRRLSHRFAPSAVPRRWRFVRMLPVNAQGKVPMADLEALFRDGQGKQLRPAVLEARENAADGGLVLTLDVTRDIAYFDGHFSDYPVLPGVVQVDWAIAYGRERLGVTGRFVRLEAIKFFRILPAGTKTELALRYDPAAAKLYFEFSSALGRHASGRVQFEAKA